MHEPKFKAVEMVRSLREAHYARLKGLSPEEKVMFFREKALALHTELGRRVELPQNLPPCNGCTTTPGTGIKKPT